MRYLLLATILVTGCVSHKPCIKISHKTWLAPAFPYINFKSGKECSEYWNTPNKYYLISR